MRELSNYIIRPNKFRLDGGAMFGIIPRPMWSKVAPPDELNRIDLNCQLWVKVTANKVILIDTGIGDYHDEKFNKMFDVRTKKPAIENCLKTIGIKLTDVTDLVLSHLHFDHVGGLGTNTELGHEVLFKNATLHLHREHYNYAQSPSERDKGSFHNNTFKPLLDYYINNNQIHWLTGKDGEIIPEANLKFLTSMGHTPWLCHPYDEEYIYLADIIPTSNHIHIPWVMGYDINPATTTKDKRRILEFVIDQNLTVIFEHDPKLWGSKVSKDEKNKFTAIDLKHATNELSQHLSGEVLI